MRTGHELSRKAQASAGVGDEGNQDYYLILLHFRHGQNSLPRAIGGSSLRGASREIPHHNELSTTN